MSEVLNNILEKQNSERLLEYIAAARSLYASAKKIAALQMFLSIPVPIALSVLAILHPEHKVWAAVIGIFISIFDVLVCEKFQKDWKKAAALAQERFDCELLELEWNGFKVGDKPTREKTHKAAEGLLRKDSQIEKIKDWYSVNVGKLPLYLARIVCQRSSIFWDSELRRRYILGIMIIAWSIGIGACITGIALKMTMETFVLSLLAPISPTILWSIREVRKQKESATTLDRLLKYAQQLWKEALEKRLSPDEITYKSRELQDEPFIHRYSNQPIFDWIYNSFRKKSESQMNIGAEELVEEALRAKI